MYHDLISESLRDGLPGMFKCSPMPKPDVVRVATPLLYPDGGIVDVYVHHNGHQQVITDFGDALGWLGMQSAETRLSPTRQWMVDNICQTLGVEMENGAITLAYTDDKQLADAVHRVAQAASRVADIWFTLRVRPVGGVADELEAWLGGRHFTFDKGAIHTGRSGRDWTVDYRVTVGGRTSLVFVLSSRSRAAAGLAAQRAYEACSDLLDQSGEAWQKPIISLFDDIVDVWQEKDIEMLRLPSRPVMWSRPDELERALRVG